MQSMLKKAGFTEVGRWELGKRGPTCILDKERTTFNVLYAFVSSRRILYVGKTTLPLGSRMYQYQRPGKSQRTNIRVNALIEKLLADAAKIKIFALPDPGNLDYKGFHLNLAAGIEDGVISSLQPEWNIASR
jgi:hypothetical protein